MRVAFVFCDQDENATRCCLYTLLVLMDYQPERTLETQRARHHWTFPEKDAANN